MIDTSRSQYGAGDGWFLKVFKNLLRDLDAAMEGAEKMSDRVVERKVNEFVMSSLYEINCEADGYLSFSSGVFDDWASIGGYRTVMQAHVQAPIANLYRMSVTVTLRDIYDFNSGYAQSDNVLDLFPKYRLARAYLMQGSVVVDLAWERGKRFGNSVAPVGIQYTYKTATNTCPICGDLQSGCCYRG
jgi:hypothetical protein